MDSALEPRRLVYEERRPFVVAYSTLMGELSAVRDGTKAMSMFDWPKEAIDTDAEDYEEVISTALNLGLTVISRPYTVEIDGAATMNVRTFILLDAEAWRVPAFMMLMQRLRAGEWSDELESIMSELLGYNKEQVTKWMDFNNHRQIGWRGMTILFLLNAQQLEIVRSAGYGSFPRPALTSEVTAFVPHGFNVLRRDADAIAQNHGFWIGRAAFKHSFGSGLFGNDKSDVVSIVRIRESSCVELNANMYSKIQVFSAGKWKDPCFPSC